MAFWSIALNTIRESLRNRVLINILLFAIALILLSLMIGEWSLGEQVKVIKDFGLSAMSVFGLLIAVFIGIRLMVQELEQRTLYFVASKPISRWQIVLGKYTGLSLTLLINVIFMTLALLAVNFMGEHQIDFGLLPAVFLIYIEILLIVAVSMFFSSLMSPQLAAVATLIVYIIGHLTSFFYEYIRVFPDKGFHWLFKIIYYGFPDLEKLNIKMAAVEHLVQPPHMFGYAVLYGLSYTGIIILFTSWIFSGKDLK